MEVVVVRVAVAWMEGDRVANALATWARRGALWTYAAEALGMR